MGLCLLLQFDPYGNYVKRWRGVAEQVVGLHTVDAADWPNIPPTQQQG